MKYKVVYIDYNFIDKRYPNSPEDGDRFFTYGWGSILARRFKKYNSDFEVECWKADPRIKKIYKKTIEEVNYTIFPAIKFGKLGYYSRSLLKHLKKEISASKNVIFNVSSIRHLLFYTVAFQLKNVPLVVQNHGEASAIYKTKINKGIKKLFYLLQIPFEKMAFKNMDLFYVLDKEIISYLPDNNKNLKIEVSTTGVDEDMFKPLDKTEAKKLLGWDTQKKHVLYVGRLNYTKRPDMLIGIHEEFQREGRTDIEIVFAGTEIDDPLYSRAEKTGIRIYPKILQTELYKYLSAADIYILAKYKEDMKFLGIGMLPVQAMLCNTPVVGYSLKNFAGEIGKVGIYTENKDEIKQAILKICENKIHFDNLREIAIKYYSWKTISERKRLEYKKLIRDYYGK